MPDDGYSRQDGGYPLPERRGDSREPFQPEPLTSLTSITIDEDGGVTIASPAVHTRDRTRSPRTFGDNLALKTDCDLAGLGYEIIEGIDADEGTRRGFIDNYVEGLDLLGLKIEDVQGSKTGPTSKIGHPLMLGAVVKAQAAASAELLPAVGPAKVKTHEGDDAQSNELAQAFERDLNYYLTTGAKEYYPDLDRGLFGLALSGNLFRKVYFHPIKRRPVCDSIEMTDLIVSEDATDLDTATRITHRAEMSRASVRRMQWLGEWRDCPLSYPMGPNSAEQRARDDVTGTRPIALRPQDMPYTIYETTTDLILEEHGLVDPHAPDDLPVSYAVTLEKDTHQVLDIRRRWAFGDEMYQRRQQFVHYGMIPALGFLCLGHLHLLGNQTKALRAIWRILVTQGMYKAAPSGIKAKSLRTSTNEINPMPGEWVDVDLAGMDRIQDAFMALPYGDPSAVFIQLADMIGKESGQLSSSIDAPMGEGRIDIPVGTILAMIEQATKLESSVHKRLHRAQGRELELLRACFIEHPEALWKLNKKPAKRWQAGAEFADLDLVPASDPNVPSQMHRIMLATAMVTVADANKDMYDRVAVHERAWRSIGVNDPQSFLHQPEPQQGKPGAAPADPLIGQARMLEAQTKQQKLAADAADMQRKAANEAVTAQHQIASDQQEARMRAADLASQERIQNERLAVERERLAVEEMRTQREHAHAIHEAGREHGLAMAEHNHGVWQSQREHERGKEELKIKAKVATKPAPRSKK